MHARVPQAMAQFVLKIEKLSHIMGPTPILEMARAYGLRPRLWLLIIIIIIIIINIHMRNENTSTFIAYERIWLAEMDIERGPDFPI